MQDCDLSARPCSHVSEFKRDVPASYEDDAFGQLVQIQELLTGGHKVFSGNSQLSRHRTGGNHYMTSFQHIVSDCDGCAVGKAGTPVKGFYPGLCQTLFAGFGHWIGERAFEAHQFRPINSGAITENSSLVHPAYPIQDVCCTHEHLLWIASS